MKNLVVIFALGFGLSVFGVDAQTAASANNTFGLKLFQSTTKRTQAGNKFLSPVSAYLALSMLYNGATQTTGEEMSRMLVLEGLDLDEVNQANAALQRILTDATEYELNVANSVWVKEGRTIKPDFKRAMKAQYEASIDSLDFGAPDAAKIINSWVTHTTKGKISGIVEDPVDKRLEVFLANAVYFNAKWTSPFSPTSSQERPFRGVDGTKDVPMMYEAGHFRYLATREGEGVELPYGKSGHASMFVFKPNSGLEQYVAGLQPKALEALLDSIHSTSPAFGSVSIPSLELSYEGELNDLLRSMGMKQAFTRSSKLDNMVELEPSEAIMVSKVIQKTYLKVYEKGTIAAAVTGIGAVAATGAPQHEFDFAADSPYLLAIRDNQSGAILFLGSIVMPEGGKLPN